MSKREQKRACLDLPSGNGRCVAKIAIKRVQSSNKFGFAGGGQFALKGIRLFKSGMLICLLLTWIISCDDGDNNKTIILTEYILEAEVTNVTGATAEIDNTDKLITIKNVKNNDGVKDIKIKFILARFVYMVNPVTEEASYDLTDISKVTVRYGASGGLGITYDIVLEEIKEAEIEPESLGWTKTNEFGKLPEGISIYRSPNVLAGQKVIACIAVAEMGNNTFSTRGGEVDGLTAPDEFYAKKKSTVIINGSYFYSTWNVGLLIRNGVAIRAANSQQVSRSGTEGTPATYYPTRGVFSFTKAGKYQVNWVYTVNNIMYGYPEPSPIVVGQTPQPEPSSEFPEGAEMLSLQDAIGAGPVLIKNSQIRNTWQEEIWDDEGGILPNGTHPRTAVGITATKIIFFVCEGRYATEDVAGLSTADVASVLFDLGCTDAMNLDGGGSTCMLINGQQPIKTSNRDGSQRAVATILTLD